MGALHYDLLQAGHSLEGRKAKAKAAALFVIAALSLILPTTNRFSLFVILATAGLLSILDHRLLAAEGSARRENYLDLLTMISVCMVAPAAWIACVIGIQASLAINAVRLRPGEFIGPAAINIAAMTTLGASIGAVWWPVLVVMPLVTWGTIEFGRDLRRAIRRTRADLESVLSATGAIAHITSLDDIGVTQVIGDTHDITGWDPEAWETMDHRDLIHPDDLDDFWIEPQHLPTNAQIDRTSRFRRPDGSYGWLRDISRLETDRAGRQVLRGMSFDVTQLEEANQKVLHQARHDQLTGLFNRNVLQDEMSQLAASGVSFALLMLDMNRFKEINDTFGHQFGDEVLRLQGDRLTSTVRPDDLVVRLGGDEFAVVVREFANAEEVVALAERIGAALAAPMKIRRLSVAAPTSIGVAMTDGSVDSAGTLLRQADIAMYDAKRKRKTVRVFTQDLEVATSSDVTLGAELIDALNNGQLLLHFQPKVDLATGKIVGAEGLARWEHPTEGLLAPRTFLHLLDVSESHRRFTDKMVDGAVQCARACIAAGTPMPIAVNVSVRSLQDRGFAKRVLRTLETHGVAPGQLVLEVTEQDLDDDNETVVDSMRQLDAAGVEFSIDDFGTGFSSLERLRDLPVHELKVDQTFVQRAPSSSKDRVIASTIIELASKLGHRVVGEGVETAEEREMLLSLGCDVAQGYIFGQACRQGDFVGLISESTLAR